jgi:hypothetical protein
MLVSSKVKYSGGGYVPKCPMRLMLGVASIREIAWAWGTSRAHVLRAWKHTAIGRGFIVGVKNHAV